MNRPGTDRRAVLVRLTSCVVIGLSGCEQEPKPAATATLVNNEQVKAAMNELSSAIDGLESGVGQFQTENWRDVVPEVVAASNNVASAFLGLRKALGYTDAK